MIEEWKPFGERCNYLVSNFGRVYSHPRLIWTETKGVGKFRRMPGRIIKGGLTKGYVRVRLDDKGYLVHRLVATLFLGEIKEGMTVNHKDLNKTNNCVTNLEWMTNSENVIHAWENNAFSFMRQVRCIDTGEVYKSGADIARALGRVNGSNLYSHLSGKQKTFAGKRWEHV